MRIDNHIKLDFDDVLITPQRSSLDSRADVNLKRTFKFCHSKRTLTCFPIISSNMDTCGSFNVSKALSKHNMLTALHKHYSIEELVKFFYENEQVWDYTFYTIGCNEKDLEKLQSVRQSIAMEISGGDETIYHDAMKDFPRLLCLDAANGYTENFVEHLKKIRSLFPNAIIMAGNVVTGNVTEELILKGADIVKVGIGSGSACLSRLVAGIGIPQVSAIDDCAYQAHGLNGHVCSDGGVVYTGDIAKAFGVGADFVMCGGLFAGTEECDGEWIYEVERYGDNKHLVECKTDEDYTKLWEKYIYQDAAYTVTKHALKFHGMSSEEAMNKWNGGVSSHRTSEGKEVTVPYKGSIDKIVQEIKGGVSSCCTYSGAINLKDLPKCAQFIRVNNTHNRSLNKYEN